MEETHIVLIEEHVQLPNRNAQVGFIELVEIIPSKRTKFPSFLHYGMEEDQTEQHSLPDDLFKTGGKELWISNGVTEVGSPEVES